MSCSLFQQHLDDWIQGHVAPEIRNEIERHLASCPRCGELDQILRGSIDLPEAEAEAGLTASILERTSGSACGRSREQIGSFVDGALEEIDQELMQMHLLHCSECSDLHRVIIAMSRDLPRLAELDPPVGFVRSVLEATRRHRPVLGLAARAGEFWAQLVQRPRFAHESAYVGALMLWLLFGTPISPLRAAPQQALSMARANPMPELNAQLTAAVRTTASRGNETLADVRERLGGGLAETGRATRGWVDAGLTLGENALESAKQNYVEPLLQNEPTQETEPDQPQISGEKESVKKGRP